MVQPLPAVADAEKKDSNRPARQALPGQPLDRGRRGVHAERGVSPFRLSGPVSSTRCTEGSFPANVRITAA